VRLAGYPFNTIGYALSGGIRHFFKVVKRKQTIDIKVKT
jgi:hypothetical protein